MSEATLIVPRRNFLIRALGFTATGAALAVPIVTMDSAEARYAHHLKGVADAMRDMLPGSHVQLRGNCLNGEDAPAYRERFSRGEKFTACAIFMATDKNIDWSNSRG